MDLEASITNRCRSLGLPLPAEYYVALCREFTATGLGDRNFLKELLGGDDRQFAQRVWEMVLFKVLKLNGHQAQTIIPGPDFSIVIGPQKVWVEAIVPNPANIPSDWLESAKPGAPNCRTVPFNEVLLRWTSALNEKWMKLEGPVNWATGVHEIEKGYRSKGIVADSDAYVIAIDGSQLSALPMFEGASRLPYPVEVVFPIGPWAFYVKQDGTLDRKLVPTVRFSIANFNNAQVSTDNFFNPAYSRISAVLGCDSRWAPAEKLRITVAHNPLAKRPLPLGVFGPLASEFVAHKINEDEYEIALLE